MTGGLLTPPIRASVHYIADDSICQAVPRWPLQSETAGSYRMALGDSVTLEMDTAFPVRPYRIIVPDTAPPSTYVLLQLCLGKALTRALFLSAERPETSLTIQLKPAERLSLAIIQLNAATTPRPLQKACQAMVAAHTRSAKYSRNAVSSILAGNSCMLQPED